MTRKEIKTPRAVQLERYIEIMKKYQVPAKLTANIMVTDMISIKNKFPGNLIILRVTLLFLSLFCLFLHESKGETMTPLTLWRALDAVTAQAPFTKEKIENILSIHLEEYTNPSNRYWTFYKSPGITLQDGVTLTSVNFSFNKDVYNSGSVGIDLEGACITLDQVRKNYPLLALASLPRGESLEEARYYSSEFPWGKISFGFKEKRPDCLSHVSLKPS